MKKRNSETFDFVKPKTTRYQFSTIPVMQRMLEKTDVKMQVVIRIFLGI